MCKLTTFINTPISVASCDNIAAITNTVTMKTSIVILVCLFQLKGFSQKDNPDIFNRISESMKTFKMDTSAVPNDQLSLKIKELRNLKGGFNINEAMEYKLAEAKSKNEISEVEYQKLKNFLTTGNGRKWLDNSIIWIYRNHLSMEEVDEAIRFYKTSAGQKMANDFPIIMAQSVKAAETIMAGYKEKNETKPKN